MAGALSFGNAFAEYMRGVLEPGEKAAEARLSHMEQRIKDLEANLRRLSGAGDGH